MEILKTQSEVFNLKTLKTVTEIRQALVTDYRNLVDSYDKKKKERNSRRSIRQKLHPKKCAACGRHDIRLELAHISPLQECAITDEKNLLWLCKEDKNDVELGCHTLYDQGYYSIMNMCKCRADWKANNSPIARKQMIQLLNDFGPRPHQLGHLSVELKNLRKQQKNKPIESQEWSLFQIQIAEVTRRRAWKNALLQAQKEIYKVNPNNIQSNSLKTRYYYEKGYIELLSGRYHDAFDDFFVGRKILGSIKEKPKNGWRWAAHTSLISQCSRLMLFSENKKAWTWDKIRQEHSKGLHYARIAAKNIESEINSSSSKINDESEYLKNEYRHAQRWVHNCLVHLIKPDLAQNKLNNALTRWKKVYDNWEKMDISNGWDAGFRPSHLSIYGQIMLKSAQDHKEIDKALAYPIRSLVLILGMRRYQPEGIRDTLFSIADALKRKNDPTYKHIHEVASNCVDLSSWFNPYVPKSRKNSEK